MRRNKGISENRVITLYELFHVSKYILLQSNISRMIIVKKIAAEQEDNR